MGKRPTLAHDWLDRAADALDQAERQGDESDSPEGSRRITMSDTLAQDIATNMRRIANALRGDHHIVLD